MPAVTDLEQAREAARAIRTDIFANLSKIASYTVTLNIRAWEQQILRIVTSVRDDENEACARDVESYKAVVQSVGAELQQNGHDAAGLIRGVIELVDNMAATIRARRDGTTTGES